MILDRHIVLKNFHSEERIKKDADSYAIRVDRALNNSYVYTLVASQFVRKCGKICRNNCPSHFIIYPAATIFNIIPAHFERNFLRMIQLTWLT